jgi:hypothetical protein
MGQWWSEVGAGVEQGHQCGMFGRIWPYLALVALISLYLGNQNASKKKKTYATIIMILHA